MSILPKNPNESAYVGGRKHWTDVIKNSGSGDLLIWRQPEEDFNNNSTLVVMPGEVAIFINEGKIEQVFEKGTYKLNTENYPFIGRLKRMFSGGISTFNCVVYFVRKSDSKELLWGTPSPIQVRDKVWGILTNAKAHGAYKVRVTDPGVFLEKLVGNNVQAQQQEDIFSYFEQEMTSLIKTSLSKFLNSIQHELIGLGSQLQELSKQLLPQVNTAVTPYGLECIAFSLANLDIDTSKYDALDEAQIAKIAKLRAAEGDKGVMDILGDKWGTQQAANILTILAGNPGAGGVAAAGAGLGMGMAAGGAFSYMAEQMLAPMNPGAQQSSQPFNSEPSGRFVQEDSDVENKVNKSDPVEALGQLKRMLDAGYIEQTEYDEKKKEILSRM